MAHAVQVRKSSDVVEGLWRGAYPVPVAQESDPHYMEEITEAEHGDVQSKGMFFAQDPEIPRWTVESGVLTEQDDTRPKVVFYEEDTTTEVSDLDILAGADDVIIDVAVIDSGEIDENFGETLKINLSDGRFVQVEFDEGEGSITIKSENVGRFSILDQGVCAIENALNVRIIADGVI